MRTFLNVIIAVCVAIFGWHCYIISTGECNAFTMLLSSIDGVTANVGFFTFIVRVQLAIAQ